VEEAEEAEEVEEAGEVERRRKNKVGRLYGRPREANQMNRLRE